MRFRVGGTTRGCVEVATTTVSKKDRLLSARRSMADLPMHRYTAAGKCCNLERAETEQPGEFENLGLLSDARPL